MKKNYLFAGLVLLAANASFAQTKIGSAGAPDGSAMLEVTSGAANNKGLLLPRMTSVQRNAIAAPATGLMIYNTTSNETQVNTGTPVAPIWVTATASNSGWGTTGNTGTNPVTNFLGTTDNQPMVVRTNNTEQVRVTVTGSVGIGTNNPTSKLTVADTGKTAVVVSSVTGNTAGFHLGNTNHGIIRNLTSSGGRGNDVALYTSSGAGSGADSASLYLVSNPIASGLDSLPLNQFVLKNNGYVGIGTSTPQQTLHVQGNARITGSTGTATDIAGRNAVGDVSNVAVGTGLSLTGGVLSATGSGNNWGITGNAGTNPATNFIGTTDAQPMVVRTNNTEQIRVTETGRVGIGNTAPLAKLDVTDTGNTAVQVTTSTGGQMRFQMGNANHGIIRNLTSSGGGGNDVALYTSNGGGGADLYLVANPVSRGADSLALNQFVLKGSGNVGIGTNTPAQKLHVEGSARIVTATGIPATITGRNAAGDIGNVTLGSGLALNAGTLSVTGSASNWSLTGNSGSNPATNYIGTADNQPLVVRTNNTERMRVFSNGSIGINASTTNGGRLGVNTDTLNSSAISLSIGNKLKYFMVPQVGFVGAYNLMTNNGDAGIFFSDSTGNMVAPGAATSRGFVIGPHTDITNGPTGLKVTEQGRVGIGTANPVAALNVSNGGITVSNGTTPIAAPVLNIINNGAGNTFNDDVTISSYGATTSPGYSMFTSRGTASAPANSQAGDNMGVLISGTQVNGSTTVLNTISSQYLGNGTTLKSKMTFSTSGIGNVAMTIDSNSKISIGTATPRAKLDVNGAILLGSETPPTTLNTTWVGWSSIRRGIGESEFVNYSGTGTGGFRFYQVANVGAPDSGSSYIAFIAPGTGSYTTPSDSRVKTNVNTINDGLEKVMAMHPVSYDFHTGRTMKDGIVSFTKDDHPIQTIGFLAQELVKIVPEAVVVPKDTSNELYTVSYSTVVPVLTKAIQEQEKIIETLKAENASLKADNAVMKADNATLKADVTSIKTDNAALKADASKITELSERMKQLEQAIGAGKSTPSVLTVSK